jgi:hypothetical protein
MSAPEARRPEKLQAALDALGEYLRSARADGGSGFEELCARHPDLTEELRKLQSVSQLALAALSSRSFQQSLREQMGDHAELTIELDEGSAPRPPGEGVPSRSPAASGSSGLGQRYSIEDELARGGMGIIWRVRSRSEPHAGHEGDGRRAGRVHRQKPDLPNQPGPQRDRPPLQRGRPAGVDRERGRHRPTLVCGHGRAAPLRHGNTVWEIYLSPDGRTLLAGVHGHAPGLWSIDFTDRRSVPLLPSIRGQTLAFAPDGRRLLVGALGGQFWWWPVESAKAVRSTIGHAVPCDCGPCRRRFKSTCGTPSAG